MLTEKGRAAINAAKHGDVIALADGRRIVAEKTKRASDCYKCELYGDDCDGLYCDINNTVYRNERGI